MMMTNKLGIYVHVPFCIRKCPYCGFYSEEIGGQNSQGGGSESYITEIKDQIAALAKDYSEDRMVDSIFFGGGTPTAIDEKYIIEILKLIRSYFDVSCDCEISIESNPGTVSLEKLVNLKEGGFNRISIGEQAFLDKNLKALGRIHTAEEGIMAVDLARKAGFHNINIDLMFGIPEQTMEDWEWTLRKAVELRPNHISFYSLQLEEGTPYFKLFEAGKLQELSDELDREMYHRAIRTFKENGYKHYEISNCAFPGFECRHNIKYWRLHEYLGFGPSASSYIDGKRFTFAAKIGIEPENGDRAKAGIEDAKYKAKYNCDKRANVELSEYHENTAFDDMSEYTFTGLRLSEGINYGAFKEKFGLDFREAFSDRWSELREFFEAGALVELVDQEGRPMSLRITEKGFDISNQIMAVFV